MMDAIVEKFKEQGANAAPIGGTIKFVLDDNPVYIDGTGEENVVSQDDKEADATITTTIETLTKLTKGELNPMMAVMGGKIKIKGDMGLAMKLQSLLK
jgi:putative sterol carrier protein